MKIDLMKDEYLVKEYKNVTLRATMGLGLIFRKKDSFYLTNKRISLETADPKLPFNDLFFNKADYLSSKNKYCCYITSVEKDRKDEVNLWTHQKGFLGFIPVVYKISDTNDSVFLLDAINKSIRPSRFL